MASGFSMSVEGVPELRAWVSRWDVAITDLREIADPVDEAFRGWMRSGFDSEGASHGPRWAPLSAKYGAWKASQFPGRGILERSGRLRASLESASHAEHVHLADPRFIVSGTAVPYARIHHAGDGLPQRPIARFTRQNAKQIADIMHAHLNKLAREELTA